MSGGGMAPDDGARLGLGGMHLGFQGMLLAGMDPVAAWWVIRHDWLDVPVETREAMLADLQATPEGRAVLAFSRQRWAAWGLTSPMLSEQPHEPR